MLNKHFENAVR